MKFWSGVITDKIEESKNFYVKHFNCEVAYEGDEGWFVLLKLGDSELGFMKPGLESQTTIYRTAFQGQGVWIAVDVDDVDAEYQRIKSLGTPIEAEIRDEPWGDRHFVIVDPNGIGVDIVQHSILN
jgi:predicted enzyme related to lactoylglutathione lyase